MCLVLLAYRSHPQFPLLLIANRDEFYQRPTATAAPWDSGIVAGRDLEGGGTWAGIARGRAAAVTNIREPGQQPPPAPLSRGDIPREFLHGSETPRDFSSGICVDRYRGFNALLFQLGATEELVCAGNRHTPFALTPGIHGISNGAPDAPWPKVEAGKARLAGLLEDAGEQIDEAGFVQPALALLRDRRPAPVEDLPHTGVSPALELALSPLFIHIDRGDFPDSIAGDAPGGYGTRASTVIAVDWTGRTQLWEQNFSEGQPVDSTRYFALD